jgi:hypothetical protein
MVSLLAHGSNAWGSLLRARSTLMGFLNRHNIAYLNVLKPNTFGRRTLGFGKNGGLQMMLPFPGLFILLDDLVIEREDDPPKIQDYHVGGFSFIKQLLDILRSFIFYFLWSERCRMHFDA